MGLLFQIGVLFSCISNSPNSGCESIPSGCDEQSKISAVGPWQRVIPGNNNGSQVYMSTELFG